MELIKAFLRTYSWLIGLILVLVIVLYQFVDPAPPSRIIIATGDPSGRYFQLAKRLQADLARNGVDLEVVDTAGSGENMALLASAENEVSIGFMQSGMEEIFVAEPDTLWSLGSLYYEPIWLFYRRELNFTKLTELKNQRVALGLPGSGTRAVGQFLLEENGLSSAQGNIEIFEYEDTEAIKALVDKRIDAALFTISPKSETIQELIALESLDFLDVKRSAAYTARYPFLSSVNISQGLLDLERNIPSTARTTLASTATLIVNERFHPALTPLVLESLSGYLKAGGVLEKPDEFPSPNNVGFPLTKEAEHYYEYGPPFLQRYLPFWGASLVDRLVIFIIPLLVIIIPLSKLAGPLYRWRIRSRIYRWYRSLLAIDRQISDGTIQDPSAERKKVNELTNELATIEVPLSYADELYMLKQHVEYIDRRLVLMESKQQAQGNSA